MTNIDKINKKLLYEKYCDYSEDDWKDSNNYILMPDKIANDFDFIDTFKDKIHFNLLFRYKTISTELIEYFIDLYDSEVWESLSMYNVHLFTTEFINKYYTKIKYPVLEPGIYKKTDLIPKAKKHLENLMYDQMNIMIEIAMKQQETTINKLTTILK